METIIKCLASVGLCTTALILYLFIAYFLIPKIKEIMKRQTKIQLLCQHEYVPKYRWYKDKYSEYELECRKCGHKKTICFYEEKKNAN